MQLQQLTSAAKAESGYDDAGDGDSSTGDKGEKAKTKSVWETFRNAIKEISRFSDSFLVALKNAPISDTTRKHIAAKLREYKKLLAETKNELQTQRQEAKTLSNAFDNLIFFLLPDVKIVKEALENLSTKEEVQAEV